MQKKKKSEVWWCGMQDGMLMSWSARRSRSQVKELLLDDYCPRDWAKAKRDGWKIVKVKVKEL